MYIFIYVIKYSLCFIKNYIYELFMNFTYILYKIINFFATLVLPSNLVPCFLYFKDYLKCVIFLWHFFVFHGITWKLTLLILCIPTPY